MSEPEQTGAKRVKTPDDEPPPEVQPTGGASPDVDDRIGGVSESDRETGRQRAVKPSDTVEQPESDQRRRPEGSDSGL